MQELHAALLALQEIDEEIWRVEARVQEFTPRLDALTAPADAAQRELDFTLRKLEELRADHSRLQKNAQQKEEQLQAAQERLNRTRSTRDDASARTELDIIRRALEADREDLAMTSEQATRTDMKVDDLRRALDKARTEVGAEHDELMAARMEVEAELAVLQQQRENHAVRLDPASRRLYERMLTTKSRRVLAPITAEGACGSCFNILPLQEQAEVRRGERLHRCESCGVILYVA